MNIWCRVFPATVKECAIPLHFKLNSTLTVLILWTFLYEHLALGLSSCKRVCHSPPFQAKLDPDSIDFAELSLQTLGTKPFLLSWMQSILSLDI